MRAPAVILISITVLAAAAAMIAAGSRTSEISGPAPLADFTLLDHAGDSRNLYRMSPHKAVVIVGQSNGCDFLRRIAPELARLRVEFEPQNVAFFFLNANERESRASIIREAQSVPLPAPVLLDPSQTVALELGLTRSGEAVVLSPAGGWRIVYRGSAGNLRAVLPRLPLPAPETADPGQGLRFALAPLSPVSYQHEIVPILRDKCLNCHSLRRFPPMLNGHPKLRGWAAMIRETVLNERMPPFSADPLYGPFDYDLSLLPAEKQKLIAWIDQGAVMDGDTDPLAGYRPEPKKAAILKGHKLIHTASMAKPAEIPAGGTLEYQYFQLGGPVPHDLWVDVIHVKSSNPRQLHHESLMVVPKPLSYYEKNAQPVRDEKWVAENRDGDIPVYTLQAMLDAELDKDPHFLRSQIWAAGRKQPFQISKTRDVAIHVPKGHYLILETHYMGTGKPDSEQTSIDFYGSTQKGRRRAMRSMMLRSGDIQIPPYARNHRVETAYFPIEKNIEIFNFLGHMHMRGKKIQAVRRNPAGRSETIMSIPNFYYGWQTGMGVFPSEPIKVQAGSALGAICEYDNSAENPYNPDPEKTVSFGQTVDRTEMCHFNVQFYETE